MERHDAAFAGLTHRATRRATSLREAQGWMTEDNRLIEEAKAAVEHNGHIHVRQKLRCAGDTRQRGEAVGTAAWSLR
jgi:hypothetical protein